MRILKLLIFSCIALSSLLSLGQNNAKIGDKSAVKLNLLEDFKKNVKKESNGDVMIQNLRSAEDSKDKYPNINGTMRVAVLYLNPNLDLSYIDNILKNGKKLQDTVFESELRMKSSIHMPKMSNWTESTLKARVDIGLPVVVRCNWSPQFTAFLKKRSEEREKYNMLDWKKDLSKKEFPDLKKLDINSILLLVGYNDISGEYCLTLGGKLFFWVTFNELKTASYRLYEFKNK